MAVMGRSVAMEFEIACTCGQHMLVETRYVGQEVECPGCGGLLPVPEAPASGEAVPVVAPSTDVDVQAAPPPPPPPSPATPATARTVNSVPDPPPYIYIDHAAGSVDVQRTNGKAIAALVAAIIGMLGCLPIVPSVIALVLASHAKDEIQLQPNLYTGTGIATAAQICAVIGLLVFFAFVGCPVLVF
jgi:hypothetical protein